LPHGLAIDHEDNLWLTDVGSHQVCEDISLSSSLFSHQSIQAAYELD